MAETNVQEIPGPMRFTAHGESFQLDLLDTIYALHDVAQEYAQQGKTHRDYLGRVIEHVGAATGVTLSYGEADYFNDHLEIEFARQKKMRREAIASVQTLPSSTPSTPAD